MGTFYSQLIYRLPYPTQSFAGRTIIVTGSNCGIGLEAARHFVRLDAARVILAVRNLKGGEEAKADIERTTQRAGVVEVWDLDLSSYANVKAFAARANRDLQRLDIAVLNASVATLVWGLPEGLETHVTVNVVSTFMLLTLLLPLLRKTAAALPPGGERPHICLVGSGIHHWLQMPPSDYPEGQVLANLSKHEAFPSVTGHTPVPQNYILSKLLQALLTRELAPRIDPDEVVFNYNCPGLVKSNLRREWTGATAFITDLVARNTEAGSRTLLAGSVAGKESHGKGLSDAKVQVKPKDGFGYSPFVLSADGKVVQERAWREIRAVLEREGVDVEGVFGPN